MTDYTELVEALRFCARWHRADDALANAEQAAAAIEDLQKDLTTLQKCYEIADTTVDDVLKQLPKRGEWEDYNGHKNCLFKCSVCGSWDFGKYRYCHVCGAKMEVQE